jgi:hypothetical protein
MQSFISPSVFAVNDYKADGTNGLNDSADLKKLPKGYSGVIWTDQIDPVSAVGFTH